jgi:DNA-binding NarL/FixJ family response regulator
MMPGQKNTRFKNPRFPSLYSPEIEVVGEASNGNEPLVAVNKLRPHVVVMDINMSNMNGIGRHGEN